MPESIIDLLQRGREANLSDPFRKENVIFLPGSGELVATGDIHGHRRNFERIVKYAALEGNPERHLMLHEIIHGGPSDKNGGCLSYELLFEAVKYKLQYPDQVHFVLSNHDTAFINNSEVMKDGKEMNKSMRMALDRAYSDYSEDIKGALRDFLFSQALGIRCENRIWLSHSLVQDRYLEDFDTEIFERPLRVDDVKKPGSVYLLTWGRRHSQDCLDELAKLLDVDIFVVGHQSQPSGWKKAGDNLLIIASDHNHGCLLHIDLGKHYNIDELSDSLVFLASLY